MDFSTWLAERRGVPPSEALDGLTGEDLRVYARAYWTETEADTETVARLLAQLVIMLGALSGFEVPPVTSLVPELTPRAERGMIRVRQQEEDRSARRKLR